MLWRREAIFCQPERNVAWSGEEKREKSFLFLKREWGEGNSARALSPRPHINATTYKFDMRLASHFFILLGGRSRYVKGIALIVLEISDLSGTGCTDLYLPALCQVFNAYCDKKEQISEKTSRLESLFPIPLLPLFVRNRLASWRETPYFISPLRRSSVRLCGKRVLAFPPSLSFFPSRDDAGGADKGGGRGEGFARWNRRKKEEERLEETKPPARSSSHTQP